MTPSLSPNNPLLSVHVIGCNWEATEKLPVYLLSLN